MSITTRKTRRVDYRELHKTGQVTYISHIQTEDDADTDADVNADIDIADISQSSIENLPPRTINMSEQDSDEIHSLIDEANDHIDEFVIEESPVSEISKSIDFLENLRKVLRNKARAAKLDLEANTHPMAQSINTGLFNIRACLLKAKSQKNTLIEAADTKPVIQHPTNDDLPAAFIIKDINQNLSEIQTFTTQEITDITKVTDKQLIQIKKDIPSIFDKLDKIASKYEKLLQLTIVNATSIAEVAKIDALYEKLNTSKSKFVTKVNKEYTKRELDKNYDTKLLHIKLDKFSGYDSTTDFYTFRNNFEKLHLTTTPTRLLPDLLKNNYLSEPALSLVKSLETINDIWTKLENAYGNTKTMLQKKLQTLSQSDLKSSRDPEKLVHSISKFTNIIREVMSLAKKFNIENNLYFSNALSDIYQQLGDGRFTRFLSTIDDKPNEKETWERLLAFLDKEEHLNQQKLLVQGPKTDKNLKDGQRPGSNKGKRDSYHGEPKRHQNKCQLCGESPTPDQHRQSTGPNGMKIIQYYTCQKFVESTPAARLASIKAKGFCTQCLLPGADATSEKHKNGKCQREFTCPHPSHQSYPMRRHVLVCEDHKEDQQNKDVLNRFKARCLRSSHLPDFSKQIKLSFFTNSYASKTTSSCEDSVHDKGIYKLQTMTVNGNRINAFFDDGCSDFIISAKAVTLLGPAAKLVNQEQITVGGLGESVTKSTRGTYQVNLPMHDGEIISLVGICLDRITSTFPYYPLIDVEREIQQDYQATRPQGSRQLPKLPPAVGGDTHLMFGIKYLRYFPKLVHQLESGLSLFESPFLNSDGGGRGVVGGPHKIFTQIHDSYFTTQSFFINRGPNHLNTDVPLLGYYSDFSQSIDFIDTQAHLTSRQRLFELAETTGSEITYRCPTCRTCSKCKNHDEYETISLREEVEQHIIESSITLNHDESTITATLPFISDPKRLANNKSKAMKVYNQQLRKLNLPTNAKDKQDILDSEAKLQKLGYVEYLRNLPDATQRYLRDHTTQYYIPWRAVWKGNSVSTPCRVVFDASQPTSSGYSLNDLLAKGRNNLNKLQEVVIRWFTHQVAIHTDISKMYNTIKLQESDWCYQRYIWEPNLDPTKLPEEKIIKTLIYGVRSSGNQSEYGLRKIADLSKEEYPKVNDVVQNDVYVDDCLSGEMGRTKAHVLADGIEVVLGKGNFRTKGVSFSGEDPIESLTDDGETIHVAGMKWHPKNDTISLNLGELNFAKKSRGRKPTNTEGMIPATLTRRHCSSKVGEIFDLTGKVTPIVASMKLDIQDLTLRQLNWDDKIPDELRPLWESNFEMIKELKDLRFNRAIIPIDAVSLDVQTLDFGDASKRMICVCIYVRFKRRDGTYSCQLVLGRSKVVPKGMTLPRAELFASLTSTYTGEIVRRSFKNLNIHQKFKFTDNQISLFWITNPEKSLTQWVRNRVIEILRFTKIEEWFFVESHDMVADIGTRRGATLKDVDQNSVWINGYPWMKLHANEFPTLRPDQIRLSDADSAEIKKEMDVFIVEGKANNQMSPQVKDHYAFSSYLIDPNRFWFTTVVRIFAYVLRFLRIIRAKRDLRKSLESTNQVVNAHPINHVVTNHQVIDFNSIPILTEEEIASSETYFYQIATKEVYQFVKPMKYEKLSKQINGILYYTGRILPADEVTIVGQFTTKMKDLAQDTFCVPVVHKNSPVAISIAMDTHWNHPSCCHSGIETTLRYILKKVYIIEGRSLVKYIRKSCQRCRYLQKKSIQAAMGPLSTANLTIAPAFYSTQIDLSGPYLSFHPQNKRKTVKIWLTVFCCCATSAVSIKVMDNYATDSFLQSFIRFSCDHGYPKELFCDGGSQIVSGCENMQLDFKDLQSKIHRQAKVEFSICPVGGHNEHGKVERKIKEINQSIEKNVHKEKLSLLQWETLCAVIANTINDLPIGVNSKIENDILDLITPNRLLLGRNNHRSPIGDMMVTSKPSRIIRDNQEIYNSWFQAWLIDHVPNLMNQEKWFNSDRNIQVGDVVLFKKSDSSISKTYQYGIISSVCDSKDGVIRKVLVRYCNANESTSRETYRSIRDLVLIKAIDESDVYEELAGMV